MTKVTNMRSSNGNKVANQFIIEDGDVSTFQSYETIIAKFDENGLTIDENAMNYSSTTSKYLYRFTNMNRKELERGVLTGKIKLEDLN